jgi:hypothetical protein
MGCDYYLITSLEIEYTNGTKRLVEISKIGQYIFTDNTDNTDVWNAIEARVRRKIVYENGVWLNTYYNYIANTNIKCEYVEDGIFYNSIKVEMNNVKKITEIVDGIPRW